MESTLSGAIRTESAMAQYDAACKRLLSEKSILAWILKDCVEEFQNTDPAEIAARYIEGTPQIGSVPVLPGETNPPAKIRGAATEDTSLSEGTVHYDIRFLALVPGSQEQIQLIINVEAQNAFYPGYPLITRAIYYCSRLLSAQYGVEFSGETMERSKRSIPFGSACSRRQSGRTPSPATACGRPAWWERSGKRNPAMTCSRR